MIPCSYPIGVIPRQELTEFMKVKEETFHKLSASFNGMPMDVIISEYVWSDEYFGKVKLTGYPTVYRDEDGRFVLAWFAHTVSVVEEDTPENNDVSIVLHVSKVQPLNVSRKSEDLLKFIGTQCSFDKKLVVLYCIAKGQIARQLSKMKPKDILTASGTICMHRGYRNIMITDVESYKASTGSLSKSMTEE